MIHPRLKESTQWTPLPNELMGQIQEIFSEKYADEYDLKDFQFICEGQIYKSEVLVRVGLNSSKQLKQHNFDLSLVLDKKNTDALGTLRKGLNYFDSPFTDLLEEDFEDHELPRAWTPVEKGNFKAHLKYSTENTVLEKKANEILDEYDKKLVYGEPNVETTPSPIH